MRIVIDMQGAQSVSRSRGIGRYTLSLSKAIIRNRGDHEIFIALNGSFTNTIEPIRAEFNDILPQDNICVWNAIKPVAGIDDRYNFLRQAAEYTREAFLASLNPDFVQVSSLFEGYNDEGLTSIGSYSQTFLTAVTLYDLIPYIHRKIYLNDPRIEAWYLKKIEYLRRADLWLAISEATRNEGVKELGLPDIRTINISTDADAHFQTKKILVQLEKNIRKKYGLNRPFLMYTGGIDYRKNIDGLIHAFAKIPLSLRNKYQLAIVCSAEPNSRQMLSQQAAKQGLNKGEIVFTGFVSDEDLVALYNLCELFIFPSWHEGFGLPVLEAMRCGAPVIGSNTSSLPEVIGLDEALFDPHSTDQIAAMIERVLSDNTFRHKLLRHSKIQALKFSWDETAKRAIAAMEQVFVERRSVFKCTRNGKNNRPKLAYVSPLPPQRSGIADYSAELLPALSKYYTIDVIVAQDETSDPWVKANCGSRSAQWFVNKFEQFDRVIYHFGNSTFHQHMFELLKAIPGVVVIHDFFLSGVLAHMEEHQVAPMCWAKELYNSHGYGALFERFHNRDTIDTIYKYPCNLSVIQNSLGVIVHSPNSIRLAHEWFGKGSINWEVVPLVRNCRINNQKNVAKKDLGFSYTDFIVCSFGILGPTKLNHRLLQAWLNSSMADNQKCHLVFVGENNSSHYGHELLKIVRSSPLPKNIHITGWVSQDVYCQYLAAADIGVQLRSLSRGETSASVLDCMNFGLATIINANGSNAFLEDTALWKLPDDFLDEQLIIALETLWQNKSRREKLGVVARDIILKNHNSQDCSVKYFNAIENFYRAGALVLPKLTGAIGRIREEPPGEADLIKLADAIARSFPPSIRQKQLLVDISELVRFGDQIGIHKVVRSILKEWLMHPPAGHRVEPVYSTVKQGYRYARKFTQDFLCCKEYDVLQDEPIDYASGDKFFGMDFQPQVVPAQRSFFQTLRRHGVQVKFAVYDLLCIVMPQHFSPGAVDRFKKWLEVVAESDGVWCISKSVADEFTDWVRESGIERQRPLTIDWSHLGADFANSKLGIGLPKEAEATLDMMRKRNSFIMVGRIEPRKGHSQVLDAFDQLWLSGIDVNLVVIGKQGWQVKELIDRIHSHPERNKRLLLLEGISDEYREKVYGAASCLIAASYGEGFGLPLIEAAQHNTPIIARDIPVFREVAGEDAYYFEGKTAKELAQTINEWLHLHATGKHPKSNTMSWLTLKESAAQLARSIIKGDSQASVIVN